MKIKEIDLERGKSYQWYYDRIISHGYPHSYATLEADEQCQVWGDGIISEEQQAEIDKVTAVVYG